VRDHPIFQDPEWIDAQSLDDWIKLFNKYLAFQYDHYLQSILIDLSLFGSMKKQSSSPFDFTFEEMFIFKFCTTDSLEALSDWLCLSMFDEEINSKYMIPPGFSGMKNFIEASSIQQFTNFIRSKIEFAKFHVLPASRYLPWVNLLSITETVEQKNNSDLMKRFRKKLLELCSDDAEVELNEGLFEFLHSEGLSEWPEFDQPASILRKANYNDYDETEREFAAARIADFFDENDLLTSWAITKFRITLNSSRELFTRIYREYGKIREDEVISDEIIINTGYKIIDQTEAQIFPHTAQESHLWGVAHRNDVVSEYEEEPVIKQEMFTPLRYSIRPSASILKKSEVNQDEPKKFVRFKL
jgi:hypothetical protein